MTLTTDHPESQGGIPVFVAPDGHPIDYAAGVRVLRDMLGMSTAEFARACGCDSGRTVENWEQGRRVPNTGALNLMAGLLRTARAASPPGRPA